MVLAVGAITGQNGHYHTEQRIYMSNDFQEYYQAALPLALAYPGLTEAEYEVMGALVSEFSDTPAGLSKYISAINNKEFEEDLARQAVTGLIQKGYAHILNAEQITRMREGIAREDFPALDLILPDNCFHPGEVDLTERGYFAYREVIMKVYGKILIYHNEAGWVDDDRGTIKVYAGLDWALYTNVGQAIESLTEDGKQILAVHNAICIGRYRPNRFITFPFGLCVIIEYADKAL